MFVRNRCIAAPSMPYSFIQAKWRATVFGFWSENRKAGAPEGRWNAVGQRSSASSSEVSGHRSIASEFGSCRIAAAAKPMAPPHTDGAIAGAVEPALIAGNMDTAQRRVEMGRAAACLGPRQARGDDHQRLQKQGNVSTRVTQHEPSLRTGCANGTVAAADYVLITSWNEWHEGSELEPSVEYGSRSLDDTAAFSQQFLVGHR